MKRNPFPKSFLRKTARLIPILFFIGLLLSGLVLHDNYGGFTDELMEIETAVINLQAFFDKIPIIKNINQLNMPKDHDFSSLPSLVDYEDRGYGTAVMTPTILVNLLPGIQLDIAQLMDLRRFYVFFNFWLATICFYRLLLQRFDKNRLIALTGPLMLVLTPRLFAESFYNCKDMIFFSWFLISLCGLGAYQSSRKNRWLILFVFAAGLAINTRYYGIVLLAALVFCLGINLLTDRANRKRELVTLLLTVAGLLIWIYLVTPFLWTNNLSNIRAALGFITDQPVIGDAELFMGRLVAPREVWYYIPIWMGITIPVLYLGLFLITIIFLLQRTIAFRLLSATEKQKFTFDLMCLLMLLGSILAIGFSGATIYHGWRHVYFLYAPFIYLSVYGLARIVGINDLSNERKIPPWRRVAATALCLLSFSTTTLWTVRNHPLDFAYFNEIGRRFATNFSRDYWGVASKSCVLDLLHDYNGRRISLALNEDLTWGSILFSIMRLPKSAQEKFDPVWKTENAEEICFSYKNTKGNQHQITDFELIKSYTVDGYDVAGLYKRIRNFKFD